MRYSSQFRDAHEDAENELWRSITWDFGKKSHRWHGLQIYVPAAREVFIYDGRYREDGDEEPGLEGEKLVADGWTARGVYSDGPRRLTGRPGPSEVEIFYLGIYVDIISN